MSFAKYKLIYFHLKGRGEVTRTLFNIAGEKFQDVRIPFEEWPQLKPNFPFHQLPLLEVTDKSKVHRIAQSHAIERFLGNRFGLMGKNDIEKAQCDMICEHIVDTFNIILFIYRKPDSDLKRSELEEAIQLRVPKNLTLIEKILEESKSGFLVGDSLSLVDVRLINFYDWLRDRKSQVLAHLPNLRKHDELVRSQPKVADQLAKSKGVRLALLFPD